MEKTGKIRTTQWIIVIIAGLLAYPTESQAEDLATTATLPSALTECEGILDQLVSMAEAKQVKGQALDIESIAAASARISSASREIAIASIDVRERSTVSKFPGEVSYFSGFFFGKGLLVNTTEGTGAIFHPGLPELGAVFFSDLQGKYYVQRDGIGSIDFISY